MTLERGFSVLGEKWKDPDPEDQIVTDTSGSGFDKVVQNDRPL